jgi:phosphoserine phosphatase RsbU/P
MKAHKLEVPVAPVKQGEVDALLRICRVSLQSSNPQELVDNTLDELLHIFTASRAYLVTGEKIVGRDSDGNVLNQWGPGDSAAGGLSAPLVYESRSLGVVHVMGPVAREKFEPGEAGILETIAKHFAIALDTAYKTQFEFERKELFKSLEVTRAVESLLLPAKDVFSSDAFSVAGCYQPAYESGGDWWAYEVTAHGNLLVLVADVTGHGVGPAMVTAAIAGIYKVARVSLGSDTESIPLILEWMNAFIQEIGKGQYSATMSIVEIDKEKRTLNWWSAAAPPIFKLNGERQVEPLVVKGAPLGSGRFLLGHVQQPLEENDMIMIFTDGINELDLPNGTQLGIKRLTKIFNEVKDMSAADGRTHIVNRLAQIRGQAPRADDGTFILLKIP